MIARWKVIGLGLDLGYSLFFVNRLVKHRFIYCLIRLRDWLRVPKVVNIIERLKMIDVLEYLVVVLVLILQYL
jgi:hypothetical protein